MQDLLHINPDVNPLTHMHTDTYCTIPCCMRHCLPFKVQESRHDHMIEFIYGTEKLQLKDLYSVQRPLEWILYNVHYSDHLSGHSNLCYTHYKPRALTNQLPGPPKPRAYIHLHKHPYIHCTHMHTFHLYLFCISCDILFAYHVVDLWFVDQTCFSLIKRIIYI